MGYCVEVTDTKFFISANDMPAALKACHKLGKSQNDFHWVRGHEFSKAKDLEEVFDTWGWQLKIDEEGNAIDVSMLCEKLGAELKLFEALAPYVKSASYIEMCGEDGATWRYTFNNGKCKEVYAKMSFDLDEDSES